MTAESLGLATEDVVVVSGDTDTTPVDYGPIASRTTYVTG
ncbi:MAG: molybdopterin-dependent oxidoreductase, partial [Variibacter sp.]|nr:molybdopterin-dependent oxidoreductase [Variibacter sp.]